MRDDHELLHGNPASIADYLGVDVRTVRRWKKTPHRLPMAYRKLLALRFEGDAAALLGKDWEGFYFQQGELYIPFWKYGFSPAHIKSMFFKVQQVDALEQQIKLLNQRIQTLLCENFVNNLIRPALEPDIFANHGRFAPRNERQPTDKGD